MENTQTAAQRHCLCELIGEAHSRIEIVVSADVGLGFISGAEGQVELLRHFPVVLDKRRRLQLIYVQKRIAARLGELQRRPRQILAETRKGKRSEKIILLFRMVHSVEALETGLYRPL